MVNVIIPCYNGLENLKKALDSLCLQTKKLFIVTVVDDYSEDNIKDIVHSYKDKLAINYIRTKKNIGPGLARQEGLNFSYANELFDYVMFLDSDDILYPRAIDVLYREAKITNADVLYSNIQVEEKGGPGRVLNLGYNTTWTHGKMYKLSFLQDNEISFPEVIRYNEDSYFNLIVNFLTKNKFSIDEITYLWRDNKQSLTREDRHGFALKANWQYVIGQCLAVEKIIDTLEEVPKELIFTLENIYYKSQLEYYKLENNSNIINPYIKKIFSDKRIKAFLENKENKKNLAKSLHAGEVFEKEAFFYIENFYEWMERILYEDCGC
jgi:glycosyltransferase involved in cell wall biosynthesis